MPANERFIDVIHQITLQTLGQCYGLKCHILIQPLIDKVTPVVIKTNDLVTIKILAEHR